MSRRPPVPDDDSPASALAAWALRHTPLMITLYDLQSRVLYRNAAAHDAAPQGGERGHRFVDEADHEALRGQLRQHGQARCVARVHTAAGERWHEVHARHCQAQDGRAACVVSEVDVTEFKRMETEARHLADHDALTGLPNRAFVQQQFGRMLAQWRRLGLSAALVFVDLDHFKTINDSLGHAMGDRLLVEMARRLRAVVREGDLVARLGGDEFLVLAKLRDGDAELAALTARLLESLSRSVLLGQTEVQVTPSLGTSRYPQDGQDLDTLMRQADIAMYSAKDAGRSTVAGFTPAMKTAADNRLSLETELRRALGRGEFELFYQPRLTVGQQLVGAEALLRWRHPERGLVAPSLFVRVCEEIGLLGAIGEFVLDTAARQQQRWQHAGHRLKVAVNLSPRQLASRDLLATVQAILARSQGDASALELEVTESVLLGNDLHTRRLLAQLHGLGFSIAIDDFGTGYSNLAYLQRYPIQTLKIDRSFVQGIAHTGTLTEVIVGMCRTLGLHMVAEGVETAEQLAWLAERGVQEYQGFLCAPPLPAADFDALLAVQAPQQVA